MADYYEKHYKEYHEKTFDINSSIFLEYFVKTLPKRVSILDVGCGSGRDLIWFKKKGFKVTGFERSKRLANLARELSGCEVIEGDFERYDFSKLSFDAMTAIGSLVHVTHGKFTKVFKNILECLNSEK